MLNRVSSDQDLVFLWRYALTQLELHMHSPVILIHAVCFLQAGVVLVAFSRRSLGFLMCIYIGIGMIQNVLLVGLKELDGKEWC